MLTVAMLALGACTADRTAADHGTSNRSTPMGTAATGTAAHLSWRQVDLPTDPRGRDLVRTTVACAGHWYVGGAILAPTGNTMPALWASTDGITFSIVPTEPVSAYGPSDILLSLACRGADVVAVGAQVGGAHGNPRTSTWLRSGGGPLREIPAPFEQYGGESQIFVGPVAGGAAGYVIVGARVNVRGGAGAAVWQSNDGTRFTLIDNDRELESDARGATEVQGATVADSGYVAVGGITPTGSKFAARDPLAWRSGNGRTWQRVDLPHTDADDVLLRVTSASSRTTGASGAATGAGAGLIAIGSSGSVFQAWYANGDGTGWRAGTRFGTPDGTTVPRVESLAADGGTAYTVVTDSATYELWRGSAAGGWQRVAMPVAIPSAARQTQPRAASAAVADGHVLLATDDAVHAAVWFAPTA